MIERQAITGAPCDTDHPFPSPGMLGVIDSMDYGEDHRRPKPDGTMTMFDRDTDPVWRLLGAWIWGAPCLDGHIADVAADPILTTHVIASAAAASPPEQADMIIRLAFEQAGAAEVFNALKVGGLEGAREAVDDIPVGVRRTAITECVAHLLHGLTALQLDLGAKFPDRRRR